MAYQQGDTISAADFNNLVGVPTGSPTNSNKALQPFTNGTEATQTVAGIYGVGYGDRGYGQTAQTLPNKSVGNTITSAEWTALRAAISICGSHQGTSITDLVPATDLQTGDVIAAHDGTDNPNDSLSDIIPTLDSNRANTNGGASMTLSSNAATDIRGTTWSGTITSVFRYQWTTTDAARYFFNSGGELRIRLTQDTNTTPQDSDWNTIFSTVLGTFTFNANQVSISGSGTADVITNTGYYDLSNSDTYSTAFNGLDIGSGAYSANDLIIQVRVPATGTGVLGASHGGPGNTVDILVTLQDQHSGPVDQVSANTTNRTDIYRATAVLAGISAPTISNPDTFN
jgi:hypothetical protein